MNRIEEMANSLADEHQQWLRESHLYDTPRGSYYIGFKAGAHAMLEMVLSELRGEEAESAMLALDTNSCVGCAGSQNEELADWLAGRFPHEPK